MREKTKDHQKKRSVQGEPGDSAGDNANLENVRREGERILAAANDVIQKVMSSDSQKFILDSRQQGGQ